MRREIGRAVPALEHRVHREAVVLAHGDEPALVDERVDLGLVELAALGVDAHGVARQEQVGRVVVELGALVWAERVLDGELVQAELTGELVELLLRRAAEVDPHHRVGLLEVLGDVGDRESLALQDTVAIHPGHGIAHPKILHRPHDSLRAFGQVRWIIQRRRALVPGVGLEPTRSEEQAILSRCRLPVPTPGRRRSVRRYRRSAARSRTIQSIVRPRPSSNPTAGS